MSHADKVLVLLTDKGPMRMGALGKATKCSFISQIVRKLAADGKVKTEGKRNAIVYLPGQDISKIKDGEASPTQAGKKGKRKPKRRRAEFPRPLGLAAPKFIAAVTADTNLVLIGKSPEPLIFDDEQTEKIATLMFAHFKG